MGLFCSSALELVPITLCQAIRWSMPILYAADTGTYSLEERRDGAVSRIVSVILCSSIYCVMLLCPRDITITKHYCDFYAVKPLDFPTILSLSLPRNLVTKFFVIHIVV